MIIGIDASFLRKPGTGIGVVTEHTLRALACLPESAGHRFILYLDADIDTSFLPKRFVKRVFLPFWTRDDVPRRILWERGLAREAKRDGCDAFVNLSQSVTTFPGSFGITHLMVVHDLIPILFPTYQGKATERFHTRMIAKALPKAGRILSVSETTKRDIALNFGIPKDRISVAYPDCAPRFRVSVSDEDVTRVLDGYGLERGYLYHGGGLEVRKNTERLLEAYAELCGERESVPPLVISGKIHPRRNRLATDVRGIVRKLGIADRVKLLGFVPEGDLPALYRGALLFAYPSLYEGFGLPLIEAFASGVPVLAGRTAGAVPEVAESAALLVDTGAVPEIVSGLRRLLDDPAARETLVGKGTDRIRSFSWDRFAATLLSVVLPKVEEDAGDGVAAGVENDNSER